MKFICQIGTCKRNKYKSVFDTWEELAQHIAGSPLKLHARDAAKERAHLQWKKTLANKEARR